MKKRSREKKFGKSGKEVGSQTGRNKEVGKRSRVKEVVDKGFKQEVGYVVEDPTLNPCKVYEGNFESLCGHVGVTCCI